MGTCSIGKGKLNLMGKGTKSRFGRRIRIEYDDYAAGTVMRIRVSDEHPSPI
jgi:hypothetical protein